MNSQSECKNSFGAYSIAVIGGFLIVAGLVWVMNSYSKPEPLGEDRAALRRKNLAELRAANTEVLYNKSFVWQDQTKGVVRMPIDQAMELSIRLWQNPTAARSNLIDRVEKATFVPPPPPAKPNPFD
ncbi:MAG: hypothetical protein JWR26_3970 [Pedosphaera sp.]|nr:hypothetical protein [Pedosphaera sp.]